ncbi:MAG: ribosomal RNA small subunit methyltransferase A [bacterium]|nr:MAG: ribosomal RNA small subunit methyltransferase A [bacterium]
MPLFKPYSCYSKKDLSDYLKKHNIALTKKRGQNFLIDPNVLNKLVKSLQMGQEDWVVEIGGGLGHLTKFIAETKAKIVVFEVDKKLAQLLKEQFKSFPQVQIVWIDFLKASLRDYIPKLPQKIKILANLPYYLTTPIIERCFRNRKSIESIVVTVQKELAERVIARAGTSQYGSLSVFCQSYSKPTLLFSISKHVFYPKPDVESAVLNFDLNDDSSEIMDDTLFRDVLKSVFSMRRKTLYNSLLKSPFIALGQEEVMESLERCSIPPNLRGEELLPAQFIKLANTIYIKKNNG